jgi:tRNA(fMet)-specific endonuclease VapC
VHRGDAYRQQFDCFTISSVTVMEVIKGFQQAGREDQIASLMDYLTGVEVLDVDVNSAIIAGRIYGELLRTGQTIGRADPMIAGIALDHDLTLVTGNTAHFERIVRLGYQLRLEDWRA